ncbi:ribonuclease Z [Sinomicrobium weinanense]|uniref:Ribonuclease Z n=1 Tax=Sinomicrobium weinanense TaxID=2842200 RepID=A0A926JRM4_9FLAO|nr:ribonuclease Z [Sinomicrobium weinanense]MBC9796232.1 ribonuclease Z [Sinomicrobium weinanense]MBU3122313.1 ribonuclease Z [Sinomicrobium weinanense]
MIFDKQDNNTTIVTQETGSVQNFCGRLAEAYDKIRTDNLIVNLFSLDALTINELLEFLEISNRHRAAKRSFVIVTNKVNYDEVPDEMVVVPTLQEAHDIIEMEEIERDLNF